MGDYALQIAAKMLGGDDPELLHYKLTTKIQDVDFCCKRAGGRLVSRQVIAIIVRQWIDENPNEIAYG